MDDIPNAQATLSLDVLRQFRVIYGSMRQYFRQLEDRCGLPGSQMWVLQEALRSPGIGINELAGRMGVHQSTCSLLVDKLVVRGYLVKTRPHEDHRRVGLQLTALATEAIAALPGPAEGLLPAALAAIPEVALKTLYVNLSELIRHFPGRNDAFASTPLADMVQRQSPTDI